MINVFEFAGLFTAHAALDVRMQEISSPFTGIKEML
jgi:hypothetical protein